MTRLATTLSCVAGLLIFWEFTSSRLDDVAFLLSSPSASFAYALEHRGALFTSTLATAIEAVVGFLLAIAFSFAAIVPCLLWPSLLRWVLPAFVTSQVLPLITLAPL